MEVDKGARCPAMGPNGGMLAVLQAEDVYTAQVKENRAGRECSTEYLQNVTKPLRVSDVATGVLRKMNGSRARRRQSRHARPTAPKTRHSLQAERLDQRCESGWLLPPAGVIEEEARERRAPVFQHTRERPTRKVRHRSLLRDERQAHAIDRGTDQHIDAIDNQRSVHGDGEGLAALVELPPVHAGGPVAEVGCAEPA